MCAAGVSDVQPVSRKRSREQSIDNIPDVETANKHASSSAPRLMRKTSPDVLRSASSVAHVAKPSCQLAASVPSSDLTAVGASTAQIFRTQRAATASTAIPDLPVSIECPQVGSLFGDEQTMPGTHLVHSPFQPGPLASNHSMTGSINLDETSGGGPQAQQTLTSKGAWASYHTVLPHASTASSLSEESRTLVPGEPRALHEPVTDDMVFPTLDRSRSLSIDFQDNLADMITFEDCLSGASPSLPQPDPAC